MLIKKLEYIFLVGVEVAFSMGYVWGIYGTSMQYKFCVVVFWVIVVYHGLKRQECSLTAPVLCFIF